jgi:hypothetical protein
MPALVAGIHVFVTSMKPYTPQARYRRVSALCQFRTRAPQQIAFLFDYIVSELIEIEGDIY